MRENGQTAGAAGQNTADHRPPNIVFFFTDDQRFDTIHTLGNDEIVTPSIDALAANGVTFANAYIMGGTHIAVCMPSRAMLMSGRTLFHLQGQGEAIPEAHVTLPEHLRRHGYVTFGTGKWHNGAASYARSFSTGAQIFFGGMQDHWAVPACEFDPTGRYPDPLDYPMDVWGDDKRHLYQQIFDHVAAGRHSSDLFANAAVDFLRGYRGRQPFFLYLSFMAPHDPRTTHKSYHAIYDPARIPLPESYLPQHPFDNGELRVRDEWLAPWPRPPQAIQKHIADYYAMITHADEQIGRVIAVLKETGRADNTIVVFSGDNGLALGRHGLMGKQSVYDHSVHVPLIVAGPGIPAGEKREALCYLIDLYPTLCDLAGLPVPATVEGLSLRPALADPANRLRRDLFFAYRGFQRGLRDDRYKLIEYVVDGKRTTQLFDLEADPFERRNIAGLPGTAEHLRRLRAALRRWHAELGDDQGESAAFWRAYLAGR